MNKGVFPLPKNLTITIASIKHIPWWHFDFFNDVEVTVTFEGKTLKVKTWLPSTFGEHDDEMFMERLWEKVFETLYGVAYQQQFIETLTGKEFKLEEQEEE